MTPPVDGRSDLPDTLSLMTRDEKHLFEKLLEVSHEQVKLTRKLMTALDTLNASITNLATATTALTAAVDTAVTEISTASPTDAQILTASGLVDAQTAATTAQTNRLNAATAPVTPVIPVTPAPTP